MNRDENLSDTDPDRNGTEEYIFILLIGKVPRKHASRRCEDNTRGALSRF